jgi:hypothetical protein
MMEDFKNLKVWSKAHWIDVGRLPGNPNLSER